MPTSTSLLSFSDCFDAFDRALASPKGIRCRFANAGDAYHFRTRLNAARARHRDENADIYPADSPMHGQSEYDAVTVKLREGEEDGEWFVVLEKVERAMDVEEIE